jgi:putative DNA primase/helicase
MTDGVSSNIVELPEAQPRKGLKRILDPHDPRSIARKFIDERCRLDGRRTLLHYDHQYFRFDRIIWRPVEEDTLRADLYEFLEKSHQKAQENQFKRIKPKSILVSEVLKALASVVHLRAQDNTPPVWLHSAGKDPPDPQEILPVANGLLHLPTQKLLRPTPCYFGLNGLDYDYDPDAPKPVRWFQFLEDLFGSDTESIDALQEMFGYCLTYDTRLEKMFLIVGPKRSGKGTLARVLSALVGRDSVAGPTLASLSQNFGLQALIGKRLAIISDARLGPRTNQHVIAERLLSLSGEDSLTIDRKHISSWTGRFLCRVLIFSNELPRIADASGAFVSRFITWKLTQSFFGREDPTLADSLFAELPGILNWSIEGLQRLYSRGRFIQPQKATQIHDEMERLSSPLQTFLEDSCTIEPTQDVEVYKLFKAWQNWCTKWRHGASSVETFGRDLHAIVPSVETRQRRENGKPIRYYQGIGLR